MPDAPWIAGIDGGGNHCALLMLDTETGRQQRAHGGPANPHAVGFDAAARELIALVERARAECGAPAPRLLVATVSGAARPAERDFLTTALLGAGAAEQVRVTHDAEALAPAAGIFEPALAVIAGTGSFVWGRNAAGEEARAGGWGPFLGDLSGAYAIGQEALRAACRAHDGAGPDTPLLAEALEHFGMDSPKELIERWGGQPPPREEMARFGKRVLRAADSMDATATAILERAAEALARDALAVRNRLFEPAASAPLVLSGGVFRLSGFFERLFGRAYLARAPEDRPRLLRDPPEWGAARLALEALGLDPARLPGIAATAPGPRRPSATELAARRRRFEEIAALATEATHPEAAVLDPAESAELLALMNREDRRVARAVGEALPDIHLAVNRIVERLENGGRLFYIGAGTSGRIGALDAAECPPTFGVPPTLVQAVVAGGAATLLASREGAEDEADAARRDLEARAFSGRDTLVGLAASGRTPYVLAGLEHARALGAATVLVACTRPPEIPPCVDIAILPVVGPEVLMGSTRLKSGTAQKLVCNMLTTATMHRLGKVHRGMMVDLHVSCDKLQLRALRTVMSLTGRGYEASETLLRAAGGSVKRALLMHEAGCGLRQAEAALEAAGGRVDEARRRLEEQTDAD